MRVLILEDNHLVARGLLRLLRLLGHQSDHVSDCDAGIAALGREPLVDTVIVDLGLDNGQSGLSFLEWVRLNHPGVQRVLTTGAPFRPRDYREQPPMDVFLPKPFGMEELQRILQEKPECKTN